jgi:hypothetical protein
MDDIPAVHYRLDAADVMAAQAAIHASGDESTETLRGFPPARE